MDKDIITVNKKEIARFVKKGSKLVFTSSAEQELLKLLALQDFIKDQIDLVKQQIAEAGLKVDKDFRGVVGEKVRVSYRFFGRKYSWDKEQLEKVKPFLEEVKYLKLKSDRVITYLQETGKLPDGITEVAREKKVAITVK